MPTPWVRMLHPRGSKRVNRLRSSGGAGLDCCNPLAKQKPDRSELSARWRGRVQSLMCAPTRRAATTERRALDFKVCVISAADNFGVSTVLVVDDEPIVRDVVVRYLERDGHRTLEAATWR